MSPQRWCRRRRAGLRRRLSSSPPTLVPTKRGPAAVGPRPSSRRIRRAEYPQYVWDSLPLSDVKQSILRLDQLQAIGRSAVANEILPYSLSETAMIIIDEWLTWLLQGGLPEEGLLHGLRKELFGKS